MSKALVFRAAFDLFVYMHNQTLDDLDWDMEYIATSEKDDRTNERLALRHLYRILSDGKMSVKDFSDIVAYAANAKETMGPATMRKLCNMIFDACDMERDKDGIDYIVSTFEGQE